MEVTECALRLELLNMPLNWQKKCINHLFQNYKYYFGVMMINFSHICDYFIVISFSLIINLLLMNIYNKIINTD